MRKASIFDTAFAGAKVEAASEQDVAEAILDAAMGEAGQLRYVVGEGAKESSLMRHETSECVYASWVTEKLQFRPV